MRQRYSKFLLLPILTFSMFAYGGSFDGQWQINKEISMADCMEWSKTTAQNDNQESNAMMAKMKFCEHMVKNSVPQINIKNNRMTYKVFGFEAKCTVYPKANIFQCDNAKSTDKKPTINIINGQLVWGLPPKPGKISMKLTYDKD